VDKDLSNAFSVERTADGEILFHRLPAHPISREEANVLAVHLLLQTGISLKAFTALYRQTKAIK
jgi:hypothetical protein